MIKNWNILDCDYLDCEEVRQREDRREAQYQQDKEKYKISVNGSWLTEKPDEHSAARFDKNPKNALTMYLPECKRVIDMLEHDVVYGINVWHYRPVARLDVDTTQLLLNHVDQNEERYIVQHENGWVSNDLFDKCYHWQIATPYTLEDAHRMAKGHHGMNAAIGDYSEVWILKLGWVREKLEDVETR